MGMSTLGSQQLMWLAAHDDFTKIDHANWKVVAAEAQKLMAGSTGAAAGGSSTDPAGPSDAGNGEGSGAGTASEPQTTTPDAEIAPNSVTTEDQAKETTDSAMDGDEEGGGSNTLPPASG